MKETNMNNKASKNTPNTALSTAHSPGMGLYETDKLTGQVIYPQIAIRCAFCFDREQKTHGEIKREWSPEWLQFIPVCRKHALCDGMIDGVKHD
jgi:hypothetical protein